MIRSTYTKRLATLAVVAGAMTILVPVAQAGYRNDRVADSVDAARAAQQQSESLPLQSGYGVNRIADSVDAARAAAQRPTSSYGLFRAIESRVADSVETARIAQGRTEAQLLSQAGYGANRVSDSVEAARAAQPRPTSSFGLFRWLESQAVPTVERPLSPQSTIESGGFDWRDFGLGAGMGIGLMLLLGGLGAGVMRRGRGQVRTA